MAIKTITVRELIEKLQAEDPDRPVVFASDYGDYSHTEQAHEIRGRMEEVGLSKTAYSVSGFAIDEDSDDIEVLVIR